ncbi:MAG: chromate transporter [Acholeplasmatales bacterium]|nr:MAG: chromate transporter [Acholeplasmatales bacterium]
MWLSLFWAFLLIGMVSFGGGYAMLPLFERTVVTEQGWMTMATFVDMIAISQVTPGPIAINSATFIGYQVGGLAGAALATTGVVLIPVVLVILVSRTYENFKNSKIVRHMFLGLRPALVGLILASVYSVARNAIFDVWGVGILLVLWVLLVRFRLHPMLIILMSGLLGMLVYR